MCENDGLDFGPHIGVAAGQVVVGYAGTPVRHNCSVFGAPVALAVRCAGVPAEVAPDEYVAHVVTFPAEDWSDREVSSVAKPTYIRDPSTGELEVDEVRAERWNLAGPFPAELKGRGKVPCTSFSTR